MRYLPDLTLKCQIVTQFSNPAPECPSQPVAILSYPRVKCWATESDLLVNPKRSHRPWRERCPLCHSALLPVKRIPGLKGSWQLSLWALQSLSRCQQLCGAQIFGPFHFSLQLIKLYFRKCYASHFPAVNLSPRAGSGSFKAICCEAMIYTLLLICNGWLFGFMPTSDLPCL